MSAGVASGKQLVPEPSAPSGELYAPPAYQMPVPDFMSGAKVDWGTSRWKLLGDSDLIRTPPG